MRKLYSLFTPDMQTRKNLAERLNLNFCESMQDWEYEVSDPSKMEMFISEYSKSNTTLKEKQSLMEIILDALNELLILGEIEKFENYFNTVKDLLKSNKELHSGTLTYWKTKEFDISEKLNSI